MTLESKKSPNGKIRIAYSSDIHLEFADLEIKNTDNADVLILAGDIFVAENLHDYAIDDTENLVMGTRRECANRFREFIRRASNEFEHVIAIAGNHEFYSGKWIDSIRVLREEYGRYDNVHFLENDLIKIRDHTFVGATLWTNMNQSDPVTMHGIVGMMNDFKKIRNDAHEYAKLSAAHIVKRHSASLSYFKSVIDQNAQDKFVVVTHHAPCSLSIHSDYRDDYIMNGGFYSELSEFILDRPQIKLFIHGHMHHESDYMLENTRVVCNPRGYVEAERGTQNDDPYFPKIIDL